MKYYLKEWTDDSVSLMDEHGHVVGNFMSVEDAIEAYDWEDPANDDDFQAAADLSSIGI